MTDKNLDCQTDGDENHSSNEISEDRRRALGKLGKYAYAAPVATGLLLSSQKANAFPSIPNPGGGGFP